MKLIPKNFIFLMIYSLLPWRWGKTFIQVMEDEITLSRYFASEGKIERKISSFRVSEIKKIGFLVDFHLQGVEDVIVSRSGVYVSQEILFVMENGVESLNVRPYSKRQVGALIQMLKQTNSDILLGKHFILALKYI